MKSQDYHKCTVQWQISRHEVGLLHRQTAPRKRQCSKLCFEQSKIRFVLVLMLPNQSICIVFKTSVWAWKGCTQTIQQVLRFKTQFYSNGCPCLSLSVGGTEAKIFLNRMVIFPIIYPYRCETSQVSLFVLFQNELSWLQ